MTEWIFEPPPITDVAIAGSAQRFPVRRIFCVGRNYAAHAREMGSDPSREQPFFFTKPADALVADGASVPYALDTQNLQYEIELVVAIGKEGCKVGVHEARSYVLGYAVGNDLTRRDLQLQARASGRPWDWGKAFDHSAVISPICRVEEAGHVERGRIWLAVNDEIRQDQDVADMIWSIPEIIAILSRSIRIKPGDLIYTGTPAGVGPLLIGDRITGAIVGVGTQQFKVVAARE